MTARAMARPSAVDVPRPTSSKRTRESSVAARRMVASSVISTMNVDWPPAMSSLAPTRVNTRSTRRRSALAAGTKLPACARTTARATWRMYVDFPLMFGPVRTAKRRSASRCVSFGTNDSWVRSTTGWRPPSMWMPSPPKVGRQ